MTEKRVLLSGCGNIGFRHLQALCAMTTPAAITVVEPNVEHHARIRAQFEASADEGLTQPRAVRRFAESAARSVHGRVSRTATRIESHTRQTVPTNAVTVQISHQPFGALPIATPSPTALSSVPMTLIGRATTDLPAQDVGRRAQRNEGRDQTLPVEQ